MLGVSNKCISLQKLNNLIPNNRLKNLTQLTGETNRPIVSSSCTSTSNTGSLVHIELQTSSS